MHKILIVTFILNTILITKVFGFLGFVVVVLLSFAVYAVLNAKLTIKKKIPLVSSVAISHIAGIFAVNKFFDETWFTFAAILIEFLVLIIFFNVRHD